jgi:putative intracellular protease/amidase
VVVVDPQGAHVFEATPKISNLTACCQIGIVVAAEREDATMAERTVHLAVYDTLMDWEYGYAVAAVNDPRYQREPGRYVVRTVGATREPVTTTGGVRIVPDLAIDEITPERSAMLILSGAQTWDAGNREFTGLARVFLDAGVPVAAICGATYGLADEGMLDDRDHTSSAVEYLSLSGNYRGAERYRGTPAHTDGPLITAGPAFPVEFAREILAALDLYPPDKLDAWYGLYRTGDPRHFYALTAG